MITRVTEHASAINGPARQPGRRFWALGSAASLALLLNVGTAAAADACRTVRLPDLGWTDLAFTNATASVILQALGYGACRKFSCLTRY